MGSLRHLGIWTVSLICLLAYPASVDAGEHVRVILDGSKSMREKDPNRLAPLSTVLLYDLADPDLTLDDSFEVLPFHRSQKWNDPADPPPTGIGSRIRPVHGRRAEFVSTVTDLPYEAEWTYFYPGLRAASAELGSTPGGAGDIRVVVIVTDGVPEGNTRDEELRRIRDELHPSMVAAGIHLYVLAFGPEAASERDFFESLVTIEGGATLGRVFLDPGGDRLLGHMIDLFGHAFGYTQEPPQAAAPALAVDLEGGHTPARSAVVVYVPRPATPSLGLIAPRGAPRAPTSPTGVVGAVSRVAGRGNRGAGFALQWVLSPFPGSHTLRTDAGGAAQGQVAVLRPTRLRLEIHPRGGQALRTMARTPFPLRVLVRPSGGAQGDPGEAQIAFTAHGPRRGLVSDEGAGIYAWSGKAGAPPSGPSSLLAEGRLYDIEPIFEREPETGEPFYIGHLEVEARRGAARVGELRGLDAHRVEVFPRLRIVPTPALGDAVAQGETVPRALGQAENACVDFSLSIDVGRLPHTDRPIYGLRARLTEDPSIPAATSGAALTRASFTLDGLPLELATPDRQTERGAAAEWSKGRPLPRQEMLGPHRLCARLGRPSQQQETTLRLPLELTLLESPYDDFAVIQPFVMKLSVARPGLLERRGWLLIPLFLLLLGAAALWYLRDRPDLPRDLHLSIGPQGRLGSPAPLPRGLIWRRALGLVEHRPLRVEGFGILAWLEPTREELFRLRPAQGARVEGASDPRTAVAAAGNPVVDVQAGRIVRLAGAEGSFEARLEYLS